MRCVVTGGAGFIGSNVVQALVNRGEEVVVVDDLCTGFREHVPDGVELVVGSVADPDVMARAVEGAGLVVHLAAHRAVHRSVQAPLATDLANTHGTLTVLEAARAAGVPRYVGASSSSVYGGAAVVPAPESAPLVPRSPYAVTKLAGEHYARVYSELFAIDTVALRFFNVFGPRQRPDSSYAAVIPLFIDALRRGARPEVHGDGLQSRDFTYVDDAVRAVLAAADAPADRCRGKVYNVACNEAHTLIELLDLLGRHLDVEPEPDFVDPRPGDIRHSRADPSAIAADLGWTAEISFDEGIRRTVEWSLGRPPGG